MDAFEQQMYEKRRRQIRLFMCIPVFVAVLIGIGIYVFTYHINHFSLDLELQGEEQIVLEYGTAYVEPGASACFSGTHLFTEGMEIPVRIDGDVDINVYFPPSPDA